LGAERGFRGYQRSLRRRKGSQTLRAGLPGCKATHAGRFRERVRRRAEITGNAEGSRSSARRCLIRLIKVDMGRIIREPRAEGPRR
jgi:hypothetical protein